MISCVELCRAASCAAAVARAPAAAGCADNRCDHRNHTAAVAPVDRERDAAGMRTDLLLRNRVKRGKRYSRLRTFFSCA